MEYIKTMLEIIAGGCILWVGIGLLRRTFHWAMADLDDKDEYYDDDEDVDDVDEEPQPGKVGVA
jgi:hypothetical protein